MQRRGHGAGRPDRTGPACAICGWAGRGTRTQLHLTHGVSVWLCHTHGAEAFISRRNGEELVERLGAVWLASDVLTVRRQKALDAHLRRVRNGPAERGRPGSYSWPVLRREAERRFAAGEKPAQVIAELRATYRDGPAIVPSVRTMRRWFTQARWLDGPARQPPRSTRSTPTPGRSRRRHPLIDIILTGVAYPAPGPGPRTERGP